MRKRPVTYTSMPGPPKKGNYISEYLHQSVPVPKQKMKQIRITGARVLTSDECIKRMREKEEEKQKKALEAKKEKMQGKEKKLRKLTLPQRKQVETKLQRGAEKGKERLEIHN